MALSFILRRGKPLNGYFYNLSALASQRNLTFRQPNISEKPICVPQDIGQFRMLHLSRTFQNIENQNMKNPLETTKTVKKDTPENYARGLKLVAVGTLTAAGLYYVFPSKGGKKPSISKMQNPELTASDVNRKIGTLATTDNVKDGGVTSKLPPPDKTDVSKTAGKSESTNSEDKELIKTPCNLPIRRRSPKKYVKESSAMKVVRGTCDTCVPAEQSDTKNETKTN